MCSEFNEVVQCKCTFNVVGEVPFVTLNDVLIPLNYWYLTMKNRNVLYFTHYFINILYNFANNYSFVLNEFLGNKGIFLA